MSLTKVKNALMFLHVFDKGEETNNVSGYSDQIEKNENLNKHNLNSQTIFNIKKDFLMLTTNPEDNFEGVLSKKKYDEIMINFKNTESVLNKVVSAFSEKLNLNINCNFSSNLTIYGQHQSGKSTLLRGDGDTDGLMISIYSNILKLLSIKKKDEFLLTRIGCFSVQNNKISNLIDVTSERDYYDQIYLNSEGSYILKYFSSRSSLLNILEKSIIKKKLLVNHNIDHILLFQIIVEVRSLDEFSKRMVTQNKISLDFIEINKYAESKNDMFEINLKGFFNSLFVNFNKDENRLYSKIRNLIQRDDDFTYDLISTIVCLKKSEIKIDYNSNVRTTNKSKNSYTNNSRFLRNLDTTAASTNENVVSIDKTVSQVYDMLKTDEQVKLVVGRKDLIKIPEKKENFCENCHKILSEINEQTKYKKYLNENVEEIDHNIDFIGNKLKIINEELSKESDRDTKSKLNSKQKQFSDLYQKVCEESLKIQSLVKKVGRNLDNNLKQISTRMGKCENCSF